MHIKKGDTVLILSGDDKGKTGKVTKVFPKEGKAVVDGMNTVRKHQRPTRQGQKGQTIDLAMPMYVSKLAKKE
jgi:large subunit ribosomal protein L24